MARISFVYPIEEIVGKLKGKFGAGRHQNANAQGLRNQWTIHYGTRSTPVSMTEVAQRTRFGVIAQMVNERKYNPQKMATDQAAFRSQSTYKTLRQYLWSVCTAEYEAAQEN